MYVPKIKCVCTHLSIYLSFYLSIYLSIYLYTYLSIPYAKIVDRSILEVIAGETITLLL